MRVWMALAALAAMTTAASAIDDKKFDMPAGGMDVSTPGYAFHTPGEGWELKLRPNADAHIVEARLEGTPGDGKWEFKRSGATLIVHVVEWPVSWLQPAAKLDEYLRKDAPGKAEMFVKGPCTGWRATGSSKVTFREICLHPEYSSFAVELRYEAKSDLAAEVTAVADSLAFKPSAFRLSDVRTGCRTGGVTAAAGSLWVTCQEPWEYDVKNGAGPADPKLEKGALLRIDPATNAVIATIPMILKPRDVVELDGHIWVLGLQGVLIGVDPQTNKPDTAAALPGPAIKMLKSGGALWLVMVGKSIDAAFGRFDPVTRKVSGPFGQGTFFMSPVSTGDALFYTDFNDAVLHRLDTATGESTAVLTLAPDTRLLAFDGTFIWMMGEESGAFSLLRYDPKTPAVAPVRVRALPKKVEDYVVWNGQDCFLSARSVWCQPQNNPDAPVREAPVAPHSALNLHAFAGSLWIESHDAALVPRIDGK